ncbi:MAG: molybdopterin molybdotransferase MoeA [Myxococcales bacterium]
MKSVAEASREILDGFAPLSEERIALLSAVGRFASAEVHAQFEAPSFDNSAMDGYAVRARDVASASPEQPVRLAVRGESRAGGPSPEPLAAGTAMRIFTGAALPDGADAVVIQEDTERQGEEVLLKFASPHGHHVRARGSDLQVGTLLLPRHGQVGSGEIGLLASQDIASVRVFRRPRVAILCTGDELREIGERARPGSIVNSNAYGLAAQVLEAGGEPWVMPSVGDERDAVCAAIAEGLKADVLVLSGGVSVGDYDVVREALAAAGVRLEFWKVRMKPGKPVSYGRGGSVPVIGLPGNPVSSWVTFELFVRPGLRRMLGDPTPERARVQVTLSAPIKRKPGREEYLRAGLTRGSEGLVATPLGRQGSGDLSSLSGVDALVVVPAEQAEIGAGEAVQALLLRTPREG